MPKFSRRRNSYRRRPARRAKKRTVRKKTLVRARQPIVETKKHTVGARGGFLNPETVLHDFPCTSFVKMAQGLGEDNMIGTSIFSKYYSAKLKLVFPADIPIKDHFKAQVIWGWMTAPFNLPNSNTGLSEYTRATVPEVWLNTKVLRTVQDGFNQNVDQVNFRDKEKRLYRVEGKRWVKPDRRHEIGFPQTTGLEVDEMTGAATPITIGAPPSYLTQLKWKPMRKVKYTYTSGGSDSPGPVDPAREFYYPNESWIPFVLVYTPNLTSYGEDEDGKTPPEGQIQYQFNDCHWFTDS